jgi:hypothetical protein
MDAAMIEGGPLFNCDGRRCPASALRSMLAPFPHI